MTTDKAIYATCKAVWVLIGALFILAIMAGCSHLHVTNTTKDGRVFEACGWSFLWDRNLEGMQFDYEKGTLDVINYQSTPEKETIGKALEMTTAALELLKSVAP